MTEVILDFFFKENSRRICKDESLWEKLQNCHRMAFLSPVLPTKGTTEFKMYISVPSEVPGVETITYA